MHHATRPVTARWASRIFKVARNPQLATETLTLRIRWRLLSAVILCACASVHSGMWACGNGNNPVRLAVRGRMLQPTRQILNP